MNDNQNSPAFPYENGCEPGLTKREYMATMILQSMLSNPVNTGAIKYYVTVSVRTADDLLQELENDGK